MTLARNSLPISGLRRAARTTFSTLALAGLLAMGACRGSAPEGPLEADAVADEIARLEARLARKPGDLDARRALAHLHWLYRGDLATARPMLETLAQRGDPVAMASLVIVAHGHDDVDSVWEHGLRLLEVAASRGGDERTVEAAKALAEPTARFLEEVLGDRPGDEQRFVEWLDRLSLDALPVEATQTLLSMRASVERSQDDDWRRNYDQQGCLRAWAVGPVEGHRGALELGLLEGDDRFELDPQAEQHALSCVVRVWNPAPRAGIRRLRTTLDVPGERLRLDLAAGQEMRVYLDGEPIHRTDVTDRWPARHVMVDAQVEPGPHLLEVRAAIPGDNVWVMVRATDHEGRAVPSRAEPEPVVVAPFSGGAVLARAPWPAPVAQLEGGAYLPLRRFLALDDALADGDSDRAEVLARQIEGSTAGFAEAHLLLADFERADPTRGKGASAAREQAALQRAVELDPSLDRAHLRLIELQLDRGDEVEVIETFRQMGPGRLQGLDAQLLRWRAYLTQGSEVLAEQALDAAEQVHPDNCEVLVARRRMARLRDQVEIEDALIRRLAACPGTLDVRAEHARTRGRLDEAAALWEEKLDRVPDDLETMEALADLAVLRGDDAAALRHLERVLAIAPYRATAMVEAADIVARGGDGEKARRYLRGAIGKVPQSSRLREVGETIGVPDPLMSWRVDGLAAIRSYEEDAEARASYEGAGEVLVLDRDVAMVYPNGGQRHIVHQVVHLRSKESIDRWGEVPAPGGGQFLTLRSIKPDGTVLEPEAIAGKDGLSLRKLAVGDYVEFEYLTEGDPNGLIPGHVDLSLFRFRDLGTPYHRSELVVLAPRSVQLLIERRNDAPRPVRETREDLQVVTMRADHMLRARAEPGARSMMDELPMVRVYTALSVDDWLWSVAIQAREGQRTNPQLRALTRRVISGQETDYGKTEAIWRWVVDHIEDGGDISMHATRTLSARQGYRLMLVRAMLEVAGIRNEVWLARDRFGPTIYADGNPSVEAYGSPVIAAFVDGQSAPLIVSTETDVMPLGYLPPSYAGTDALRLPMDDDERPGRVRLPASPARLANTRTYELHLRVDTAGDGVLEGTLALQGGEAMQWRDALKKFDRDRLPEVFQAAELAQLVGGSGLDLDEVSIENEASLRDPLVLRFRATASGVGVEQAGALLLPSSVLPMNLGLPYAKLPERTLGLSIPYAPELRAKVHIELTEGRFSEIPAAANVDTQYGHFVREVEGQVGGRELRLELRSSLETQILEAGEYPALVDHVRRVQAAEQTLIRVE